MSAFKMVQQKIKNLPDGTVVTLEDLSALGSRSAIATALTRLAKENIIVRVRRGLYMKPKQSRFGALPPSSEAMLSALTQKGRKSYTAGLSAYNKLGLTTQVPNTFVLRGGVSDTKLKIGGTKIEIKAGRSPKSKSEIPLLMILDSLREVKQIPDSTVNDAIRILKVKIFSYDKIQKIKLIDLALTDKPVVRALLGAIIDEVNPEITERLKKSINPLTSFKLGVTNLQYSKRWKIK